MLILWDVAHIPLLVFAVPGYRWGNKVAEALAVMDTRTHSWRVAEVGFESQ